MVLITMIKHKLVYNIGSYLSHFVTYMDQNTQGLYIHADVFASAWSNVTGNHGGK